MVNIVLWAAQEKRQVGSKELAKDMNEAMNLKSEWLQFAERSGSLQTPLIGDTGALDVPPCQKKATHFCLQSRSQPPPSGVVTLQPPPHFLKSCLLQMVNTSGGGDFQPRRPATLS